METIIVIGLVLFIVGGIHWLMSSYDDHSGAYVGLFGFVLMVICINVEENKRKNPPTPITLERVQYIVNKCEPFGGLKHFINDDIVCADGTQIKMNFTPETKVEQE